MVDKSSETVDQALAGATKHPWAQRVLVHTTTLRYSYVNRQQTPLELWLAIPPALSTQDEITLTWEKEQPEMVTSDGAGVNRLAYFRLAPGAQVEATVRANLYRVPHAGAATRGAPLPPEEQRFYTRSSPMIVVDEEVRSEARQIVGAAREPLEQARALYAHLVRTYRYVWPPAERGSTAARRTRSGDCGEFAFVYAAWCRALTIPCRVLFGTWAGGKTAAHAWNEIYIVGIGWLPVDASVYQPSITWEPIAELDRMLLGAWRRFGRIGGDRLAFSIDPDVTLVPAFHDVSPPTESFSLRAGGRDLNWGYTSLDGAAPYLQPVYPRFSGGAPSDPADLLGTWRADEPLLRRAINWLMWVAYGFGVTLLVLDFLGVAGFDPALTLAWLVGTALLIVRTGAHTWKLLLLLLFVVQSLLQLRPLLGL